MSGEILRVLDEGLTQKRGEVLLNGMIAFHGTSAQSNVCKSSVCLPFLAVWQQGHTLCQNARNVKLKPPQRDRCVWTHLTELHELAYDGERRSIRIDDGLLIEELVNFLESVHNQYVIP